MASRKARERAWAGVFLGPFVLGLVVFHLWPIVRSFYFSFTEWGPFGGHSFNGLVNYDRLLHDGEVLESLRNSAVYTVIMLAGIPVAIVVAFMLTRVSGRASASYRVAYFLPVVTLPAAVALVWRLILNGDVGPLNSVLRIVGINAPNWLVDDRTVLIAIGVVGIWMSLGHSIIIFGAGLNSIPNELYEAASLDGATARQQLRHVTVPLLTPSIFFVSVLTVINALQMFDLMYMMVERNNPAQPAAKTIVYIFFEKGFLDNDRGYAAAIAFMLFALILVLTLVQLRLQRRWVHYA